MVSTLHRHAGIPLRRVRAGADAAPELDRTGARALLGGTLGRMHALGAAPAIPDPRAVAAGKAVRGRARADPRAGPRARLPCATNTTEVSGRLVAAVPVFAGKQPAMRNLRLHGDCHLGNILWNSTGPCSWISTIACGTRACRTCGCSCAGDCGAAAARMGQLLEGYEQFCEFDHQRARSWSSPARHPHAEPCRLARRALVDPAFPKAFPWFADARYWERHIAELQEQLEAVEDPPLLRIARG